MTGNCKIN